jgi:hypothetical protein
MCEALRGVSYFTQLNVWKQRKENGLSNRPIPNAETLGVIDTFAAVTNIGKVSLIAKSPPIAVLDLSAINHEPELRLQFQIGDYASTKLDMEQLAMRSFSPAVMSMPAPADSFLGVVF